MDLNQFLSRARYFVLVKDEKGALWQFRTSLADEDVLWPSLLLNPEDIETLSRAEAIRAHKHLADEDHPIWHQRITYDAGDHRLLLRNTLHIYRLNQRASIVPVRSVKKKGKK